MKIKFTIFAFLFLQFAESNSMMLRSLARALTVNSRVTSCPRLLLRHYMTEQEKKEAEKKFGAPAEDVEKAISIITKRNKVKIKIQKCVDSGLGVLLFFSPLPIGIGLAELAELTNTPIVLAGTIWLGTIALISHGLLKLGEKRYYMPEITDKEIKETIEYINGSKK